VRIGREHERSDARGRFRIVGIPLWANSTLAISHERYRPATFRLREVDPSFSLRQGKTGCLARQRRGVVVAINEI
jgi:hypothetical protein